MKKSEQVAGGDGATAREEARKMQEERKKAEKGSGIKLKAFKDRGEFLPDRNTHLAPLRARARALPRARARQGTEGRRAGGPAGRSGTKSFYLTGTRISLPCARARALPLARAFGQVSTTKGPQLQKDQASRISQTRRLAKFFRK